MKLTVYSMPGNRLGVIGEFVDVEVTDQQIIGHGAKKYRAEILRAVEEYRKGAAEDA